MNDYMVRPDFVEGRKYVMEHWDEYDRSYWSGIINALRSQGIREAQKKGKSLQEAKASVNRYLRGLR